jgi:hypothetical protein
VSFLHTHTGSVCKILCRGICSHHFVYCSNQVTTLSKSVASAFKVGSKTNITGQSLFNQVEDMLSHPLAKEIQGKTSEFGKNLEKIVKLKTSAEEPSDSVAIATNNVLEEIEKNLNDTLGMISSGVADLHTNFLNHPLSHSKNTDSTEEIESSLSEYPDLNVQVCKTNQVQPSSTLEHCDDSSNSQQEASIRNPGEDIEILLTDDKSFCVFIDDDEASIVPSMTDKTEKGAKKQKSRKMFWRRGDRSENFVTRRTI